MRNQPYGIAICAAHRRSGIWKDDKVVSDQVSPDEDGFLSSELVSPRSLGWMLCKDSIFKCAILMSGLLMLSYIFQERWGYSQVCTYCIYCAICKRYIAGLGVMYLSYRYVMAGSECSENPRPPPNTHLGHMCYYDDQTDIL